MPTGHAANLLRFPVREADPHAQYRRAIVAAVSKLDGITAETVRAFAELSGDFNPLHCREEYAKRFGFSGVVAHGAYQQALVSQSVGMWVIGERCLVSGLSSRFLNPLVCDITVQVSGEVVRWSPEKALGQVRVRIEGDGGSIVFSESMVDVTFHGAEVFLQTPADVRTEP